MFEIKQTNVRTQHLDDGEEVSTIAFLFEHHLLPLGLLLAPAVLQGIVALVLPLHLANELLVGHQAVGGHDDSIHEEASSC